ncbi:unnamed protein product [Arctia plantaginis]|uniref:Uncharacterized protein n=1 Tax=Arctia plantaginis TaxID=874455 RepID=A0A8S0YUU3_ARCPL|nr:unnamed protein product [Arctia plantaginis]
MDVLDSLDLDTKDKKSLRVRSWYLYEQYKSLEKHQLDAAQKLKNRSYQDKILRQELSERRARRKLCDQFGLCQSESSIQKTLSNHTAHAPTLSVSNDDFFESFSEQDDEHVTKETEFDYSEETTQIKSSVEDFKSLEERNDNVSNSDSINSVVENITTANIAEIKCNSDCSAYSENANCEDENFVSTFNESNEYEYLSDSPITPVIIAQDINKQLDSVREDIQRLEDITKFEIDSSRDDIQCLEDITKIEDKSSDNVSQCSQDAAHHPKFIRNKDKEKESYKEIIPVWSKLVNYAYQIVQLNHGNCYCDYSSQFLTAVLACDILRRCVNRMCNILQPYVSPISFVTDDDKFDSSKFGKTKKLVQSRKSKKIIENKPKRRVNRHKNSSRLSYKNYSENCWDSYIRRASFEKRSKSKYRRRNSEPWQRVVKNPHKETLYTSGSSIWSQISKDSMSRNMFKNCTCCKKVVNPMLKIARYIDSILKDINDL